MSKWRNLLLLAAVVLLMGACSPVSRQVQRQTIDIPFLALMEEPERYHGEMVLLGGYIVQTRVQAEQTEIVVLQTPLGFGDRPKEKDQAYGRILVIHDDYLEPEVYARDRAVTLAGTVIGRETGKPDLCPYPCLVVSSREIHLWPVERYPPPYPYPPGYYDPFFYDPFWDYRFRSPLHRPPFWGHPWYPYWGW